MLVSMQSGVVLSLRDWGHFFGRQPLPPAFIPWQDSQAAQCASVIIVDEIRVQEFGFAELCGNVCTDACVGAPVHAMRVIPAIGIRIIRISKHPGSG